MNPKIPGGKKPQQTSFKDDPIAAMTDRAYDKLTGMFGGKQPAAAPKMPAPSARPSMRPSPEHPGLDPARDVVPVEKDPSKLTFPAWARRGVKPPVEEARLIGQHENGNRSVKIFRDTVWNEYVVRFYLNDEYEEKADYHTDDKQDAVDTAKHWLKSGNPNTSSNISESLKTRIVRNLVRIEDILEDRKIYGGIEANDQRLIKSLIKESMRDGITFEDAVLSMIEGFKDDLDEVAPVGTVGTMAPGGTTAAPGTQANAAPTAPGTVQSKPVSAQGIEALGQVLKNAGLTPAQLSTVTSMARK